MSHSPKYNLVREYYVRKYWSKSRVRDAVRYSWITAEEYEEITGEPYVE